MTDSNHHDNYDDIIDLPYPPERNDDAHPRMPMEVRAAQFAPFAALTGLDEAVDATRWEGEAMESTAEEEGE